MTILALLSACGLGHVDNHANTGAGDDNTPVYLSGTAQKGPFIKGSRLYINRLTDLAEPTYETTLVEIR